MHRWLPNNRNDCIDFITGNSDFVLKGWFERRGTTQNTFFEYEPNKAEIDESIIEKQGATDAGSLFCELEVKNMIKEQYDTIINSKIDDPNYIKFTKRILPIMLQPINNLIRIFRQKYGQYWLEEIPPYDSRSESIGSYCHGLGMKWSNDKGNTWNDFTPTPLIMRGVFILESPKTYYENYIKKEDWINILNDVKTDFLSKLPLEFLVRSWGYFDQGYIDRSVIEGITSLELTINLIFKEKLDRLHKVIDDIDKIKKSEFPEKIILICSFYESISEMELSGCLNVYKFRNNLVHDGIPINRDVVQQDIRNLLNTISKLLLNQSFKFPRAYPGNIIQSPEDWKKI